MFLSKLFCQTVRPLFSFPQTNLNNLTQLGSIFFQQAANRMRVCRKMRINRMEKGLQYAYRDRRQKRRLARRISLVRINAGPINYSQLHAKLAMNQIELNSKSLERLLIGEPLTYNAIIHSLDSSSKFSNKS